MKQSRTKTDIKTASVGPRLPSRVDPDLVLEASNKFSYSVSNFYDPLDMIRVPI